MEGGCGTIVRGWMASAHAKVVKNTVYGEKRIRRKESDGAKLLTNQRIALNFRVDIQTCFGQIKIRWHTFFRCHFPTVRSFDGTCGVHSCRRTSCLFDSGSQWRPRICRKFTRTHRQSKSRFNYSMHVYYAIYDFVESADLQSRDPQWIYYAHKSLCFLFFVRFNHDRVSMDKMFSPNIQKPSTRHIRQYACTAHAKAMTLSELMVRENDIYFYRLIIRFNKYQIC